MRVGGCVKVSTRARRQVGEKARGLGMEIQLRRGKLRRWVEALRRRLQSCGDVLKSINTEEVVRLRG